MFLNFPLDFQSIVLVVNHHCVFDQLRGHSVYVIIISWLQCYYSNMPGRDWNIFNMYSLSLLKLCALNSVPLECDFKL